MNYIFKSVVKLCLVLFFVLGLCLVGCDQEEPGDDTCAADLGLSEYNGTWSYDDHDGVISISNDGGCWTLQNYEASGVDADALFEASLHGTVTITNNSVTEISGQSITYHEFELSCLSNCGTFTGDLRATRYIDTVNFSPAIKKYGRINPDSLGNHVLDILDASNMSDLDPYTKQ
ncbi:MAG: hypothetical protein GY754_18415 [bacterium]|nr:hypothetical protein [bacterium]